MNKRIHTWLCLGALGLAISIAGKADPGGSDTSSGRSDLLVANGESIRGREAAPTSLRGREAAPTLPAGTIRLDETVISGNQELPKVLYIVPWQQPDGLPDIELEAEFGEADLFRRLYPPAYRRELGYFEAVRASAEPNTKDSEE